MHGSERNAPNTVRVAALLFAAAAVVGCGADGGVPALGGELREESPPVGRGAGEPNLHAGSDGRLYMSWQEPAGEGVWRIRTASRGPDGWQPGGIVAEGRDFFINWADFPSIFRLDDGTLWTHWLKRSGPGTYHYDVHLAWSTDGGATWSEPLVPHRDGTLSEHGFVSLFPWSDGRLAAVWLDGRHYASPEVEADEAPPEMSLRMTTVAADGKVGPEVLLDGRVCDCCQTSAAVTSEGPIIAYRGRTRDEIRDILVVRHVNGVWTDPVPVHDDGWHIPACPVNGPSIAARDRDVAIAWFTAADERQRAYVAFSDDAGASFHAPVRVDDGDPSGRVDVLLLPDGTALVSWLERRRAVPGDGDAGRDRAEVLVRRVARNGRASAAERVASSSAARASGFPRMAQVDGEVVFAWTEPGDPRRLRVASAPLPVRP